MKVLVTGGRDYKDVSKVYDTLSQLHVVHGITCIVEGGATGADEHAREWAEWRGVWNQSYPVSAEVWVTLGKKAGPMRNRRMMVTEKPDLVVAFPGGRGAASCVSIARELGFEVREVK